MTQRAIDCLVNVHFGETEVQPQFMTKVRDDYFKGPKSMFDPVDMGELLDALAGIGSRGAVVAHDDFHHALAAATGRAEAAEDAVRREREAVMAAVRAAAGDCDLLQRCQFHRLLQPRQRRADIAFGRLRPRRRGGREHSTSAAASGCFPIATRRSSPSTTSRAQIGRAHV